MNEIWYDWAYPGVDLTGCVGVVRYLQTNNGSSRSRYDLTSDEIAYLHSRDLPVAAFWQDGATSALLGYDRGVQDALRAEAAMDELGGSDVWAPHFAVDTNATYAQVAPYFQGILDTADRPVGAYGSYAICEALYAELGIAWLIQTTSWSNGKVSPHAWLLQRDHNVVSGTSKVDVDVQLLPFYNAWRPNVATPMTPTQREAAFRAEGLPIVGVRQWWTNDRAPATGQPAGPKYGVTIHHTGGETSDPLRYASTILYDGRSDLPGPLCHDGLDIYKGVVYMVGTGRTNHAGKGDSSVKARVIADTLPYDRELRPTLNDIDGNSAYYGLEMMYDGTHGLPRIGWVAMIKWAAAICRFHGWSASAIAHREHTNTKPDPGGVDLALARRDLRDCLALPPGVWGGTLSEEDDLPYSEAQLVSIINSTVINVFRSPEAKDILFNNTVNRPAPWIDPSTGQVDPNGQKSITLIMAWMENRVHGEASRVIRELAGQVGGGGLTDEQLQKITDAIVADDNELSEDQANALAEKIAGALAAGVDVDVIVKPKEVDTRALSFESFAQAVAEGEYVEVPSYDIASLFSADAPPDAPPKGANYTDLPECADPSDPANQ